jgi:TetR/AcrR family transcriptional regulator, acrAB operon repressor
MARKTAHEAAKTRAALIDAGLVVFAEKGFARSQLDDIATRAGVTRGALYHHFADKDDLLRVVLDERWALATEPVLQPLHAKDAEEALRGFLVAYFEALETSDTFRALLTLSWSGELPADLAREGLGQKKRVFERWLTLLDKHLKSVGGATPVRARSESILATLLGYSIVGALAPMKARVPAAVRAELILSGVRPLTAGRSRPR